MTSDEPPAANGTTSRNGLVGHAGACAMPCSDSNSSPARANSLAAVNGPDLLCVAALVLGVMSFALSASNIWAITQTLAGPQAAGRWTGFQNFLGNFAGVTAPALTGFVLDRTGHFYWAFAILTAVAWTGTAAWFFLVGRVEPVSWRKQPRAGMVTAAL